MAAADYRLLTEATGVRIAEALEDVTAMVGPKGDTGEVSEAELTAKLADKADVIVDTASGAIASFPDGMAAPAKDITIAIEPVQAGSGDPSPTNVRPISGWTGAKVLRTGKNLYNNEVGNLTTNGVTFTKNRDGSIELSGTATENAYYNMSNNDLPAGTFFVTGCPQNGSQSTYALNILNVSTGTTVPGGDIGGGISLTANGKDKYRLYIRIQKGITTDGLIFLPMIRLASDTDPTFASYTGTTYPISWQSEAGTVYGGTLDVTTGLLTVTMITYNVESVSTQGAIRINGDYYAAIMGINNAKPVPDNSTKGNCLCNIADNMSASDRFNSTVAAVAVRTNGTIELCVNGITTASTLNSYLSNNNVQIVYELATPQTYQLTPTEVEMLLGENNVWADTGDSTVTYRADTKLYIQKINAPTDDDMIADAQIASGKYFIVGGNLYKSTTTIPAGDTINPGSNCILTNLADALNALNT